MKIKASIFILFLFIHGKVSFCQINDIDSAKLFALSLDQDTNTVKTFTQKSYANLSYRPLVALYFAQEALKLAEKLGYKKGEAMALGAMGTAFNITDNYPEALRLLLMALEKAEQIDNPFLVYQTSANIGTNYKSQRDFEMSILYYFKAKDIAEYLGVDKDIAGIEHNLSDSYKELGILDSARIYAQKAYEMALKLNDRHLMGLILSNLGNINNEMGQPIIALEYYRQALSNFNAITENYEKYGPCETALEMAKAFKKLNKVDSLLLYANQSFYLSSENGFLSQSLLASKFLSSYYKNVDIDSAYKFQTFELIARDSLFSQQKIKALQSLTLIEAKRQEDLDLQRKQSFEEVKVNIQYLTILLSIIVFSIMFILISKSFFVGDRTIRFLGVFALLVLFEFVNLSIHSFLGKVTHHSPFLMLSTFVVIASILIPLHHKIEKWITNKYINIVNNHKLKRAKAILSNLQKK